MMDFLNPVLTPCQGCGGDLLVHTLEKPLGRAAADHGDGLLARASVLDGYRVHGIASGRMPKSLPGVALAVHGGRMLKVCMNN